MSEKISRRKFISLGTAAAAGITLTMPAFSSGFQKKSTGDTLNLGIIGIGDRGEWMVYILKNIPGIHVTACCDILPGHLEAGLKQAESGAKGYKDYRKMLENKDLDGIIIATPLHLHFQMAKDALDADKHVFCEKTMTYNIEQALLLEKAVKSSGKIFQVGYQTRSNPLFAEIHEMINNGYLGALTHVRCNYHRNGDWRRPVPDPSLERLINWRMYREYSGGLMAELCSHHIDITNWMMDSHPLRVVGIGGIDYWKDDRETFDNVNTVYEYPNGVKAIFTSITTNAHYGVSLQYMGTKGTIEISAEEGQKARFYPEQKFIESEANPDSAAGVYAVTAATYQVWKKGKGTEIKVDNQPEGDEETTGLAFKHFADCIRNNKTPVSNAKTGRRAAIAVHMGINAMRNGTIEHWQQGYGS
ncbi:MAG: Gfo/Idh/MocA family oxidoreductase [Calditrichaeota bacterium]|nr:Gfo/Idh/MocA family oxidoreductase [Calditrichota bacterium]